MVDGDQVKTLERKISCLELTSAIQGEKVTNVCESINSMNASINEVKMSINDMNKTMTSMNNNFITGISKLSERTRILEAVVLLIVAAVVGSQIFF